MSGTAIGDWFDKRIPWREAVRKHLTEYYAPKNFNVWYAFGAGASCSGDTNCKRYFFDHEL